MTVEDRLRRAVPPDAEGARDRAWAVVEAAAPRTTTKQVTTTKFVVVRALVAGAGVAVAAGLVLSGGGAAAAEWVSDRFEAAPAPRVAPRLPAAGRLLVDGPTIVRQDGSRLRLPAADGATWSPHGLFIAAWHGKELRAMEPDGEPRWRIETTAPVRMASWSPDGLRVAYVAGNRIRIVSGNGANDHALPGGQAAGVVPAWNPAQPQQLAYVTLGRRLVIRDVGTGEVVRRTARVLPRWPESLSFSANGRWLAVAGGGDLQRLDLRSSDVTRQAGRYAAAAYAPRGERLATVNGGTLSIDGRAIVTVRGRLGPPVWSPDGRYVAASRGGAILVASADGTRLTTVPGGRLRGWAPPSPR